MERAGLAAKEGEVVLFHGDGQDAPSRCLINQAYPDAKGSGGGVIGDVDCLLKEGVEVRGKR